MKPKKISENAMPLQTHWQIVASVHRIVLNYRIALCKLKSDMEAIKHYYYITENTKSVWKSRALVIHLIKFILHIRLQLNKYVQDLQVPATPKPHWKIIGR